MSSKASPASSSLPTAGSSSTWEGPHRRQAGGRDIPTDPNLVSSFLNLRVADIEDVYERWSARGAQFLTPPIDRGAEVRCYMRDPDGHLIEVGEATGVLDR